MPQCLLLGTVGDSVARQCCHLGTRLTSQQGHPVVAVYGCLGTFAQAHVQRGRLFRQSRTQAGQFRCSRVGWPPQSIGVRYPKAGGILESLLLVEGWSRMEAACRKLARLGVTSQA